MGEAFLDPRSWHLHSAASRVYITGEQLQVWQVVAFFWMEIVTVRGRKQKCELTPQAPRGESQINEAPAPHAGDSERGGLFFLHIHILFAAVHLGFGLLLTALLGLVASASAALTGGTRGGSLCLGLLRHLFRSFWGFVVAWG